MGRSLLAVRTDPTPAVDPPPDSPRDNLPELLGDHRLAETDGDTVRLLPAAWRYGVAVEADEGEGTGVEQASLL